MVGAKPSDFGEFLDHALAKEAELNKEAGLEKMNAFATIRSKFEKEGKYMLLERPRKAPKPKDSDEEESGHDNKTKNSRKRANEVSDVPKSQPRSEEKSKAIISEGIKFELEEAPVDGHVVITFENLKTDSTKLKALKDEIYSLSLVKHAQKKRRGTGKECVPLCMLFWFTEMYFQLHATDSRKKVAVKEDNVFRSIYRKMRKEVHVSVLFFFWRMLLTRPFVVCNSQGERHGCEDAFSEDL